MNVVCSRTVTMTRFITILWLAITAGLAAISAQKVQNYTLVSFYGDGHLRVAIQDARSDTDLLVEFRTSQSNALLFLAAGATDYCVVTLQSGMIKVRLDLGSGDATLQTPPGLVFNDFQWHVVRVIRRQALVTMSVDELYTVKATTPGRFFELNIDRDVFVGGTGGSTSEVYFGNFIEFRGCMRQVHFNGLDVVGAAKSLLSQSATAAYGVDWHCSSAEFSAASDRPISFVSNTSFVAFPSLGQRRDVRLTFDLRSPSSSGVVLFNSGGHLDSDFVAVELFGGYVILRVNKGAGAIVMTSLGRVDDGSWHQIEVFIDAVTIRLTVDGARREERTSYGTARLLDVGTARLYLGGVGVAHRAAAVAARLDTLSGPGRAAGGSLNSGCIRNFKIDGRLMGLREAVVTRSVQPDCASGSCDDVTDPNHVRCLTGSGSTARQPDVSLTFPSSGVSPPSSSSSLDQVVRVRDVVVREGGSSQLTQANIDLAPGLFQAALNATRGGAGLRVVRPPVYGELFLTGTGTVGTGSNRHKPQQSTTAAASTFTLADVINGRIVYVHDGSESTVDSFGLEVDLTSLTSDVTIPLPEALRGRRKYAFSVVVQVATWNDQPSMTLPADDTLSIIAGTEIQMTPELLNATDADDLPASVELSVQYQPGVDIGYFETADASGVRRARVTRFTQADIEAGRVKFVHRGSLIQQLKLQVSDGKDVGDTRTLKIVATPLKVVYVANNGLVVARGSSGTITRSNLTFVTNAASYQTIDVSYRVIEPPFDGELQRRQYNDDTWQVTSEFSQSHVDAGRIRYAHYGQVRSRGDYFRFRVSALGGGGAGSGAVEEHEFHVRVVDARVDVVRTNGLRFGGARDSVTIGSDVLKSTSTIPNHGPADIVYRLTAIPRVGNLLRADESAATSAVPQSGQGQRPASAGRVQRRKLVEGSVFTQADVNEGRLVYRLTKQPDSPVRDSFEFRVSATGVPESAASGSATTMTFEITYEPEAEDQLRVVNNGLMDVSEGQLKTINPDDLWIERRGVTRVDYVITEFPRNGVIELVISSTGSAVTQSNVTSFSSFDLRDSRVRYRHDDSESVDDSFLFVATLIGPSTGGSEDQVSGTFEIKIVQRNDNSPVRVVDRPLYVIDGRGRVITLDDIAFTDPDTDFDSSLLEYEWRDVTNGHVVHTENHAVPIHRFTQRDIADGIVYFRHRQGAGDADTTLWVTDGLLFATGQLQIRASLEPFVRTGNGSSIAVEYGRRVAMKPDNFGLVTNVDAADRDILFVVVVPPSRGTIRRSGLDRHRFSMADVRAGSVTYEHAVTNRTSSLFDSSTDDFRFSVHIGEVHTEGDVSIMIVVASAGSGSSSTSAAKSPSQRFPPVRKQQKLVVAANRGLVVDALDTSALTPDVLNVTCGDTVRPADILYTVTLTPRYGALTLGGAAVLRDLPAELRMFSQEDINTGRVAYEHHEDQRYVDYFRFDVKCGDEIQRTLDFGFDVLPLTIPVEVTGNVTVRRGGRVHLQKELFRLTRRQFEVPDLDFLVVRRPMNGRITVGTDVTSASTSTSHFTLDSLRNGAVEYVDQSLMDTDKAQPEVETSDSFTVIVRLVSRDKQSQPRTVFVSVLPSTNLRPKPVNHRVLRVITGSTMPITREDLCVEDDDTKSDNIIYTLLTSPSNGDVIISGSIVSNFTQKQIDDGVVRFAHRGADRGSFQFDITDGVTVLQQVTLEIETTPPVLTMSASYLVGVFPGIDQPITKDVLQAVLTNSPLSANDNESSVARPIVYTVRLPPTHGRLRLVTSSSSDGSSNVDVTSFTQAEIDAGRIVYRANAKSLSGWNDVINDRMVFDVSMAYAEQLRNVTSPIRIAYGNLNTDNLRSLVVVGQLVVDEGGGATLSKSELDATGLTRRLAELGNVDIVFIVVESPMHGRLAVAGGTNATNGYRLTQRDINRNDVVYVHDGSETVDDRVRLAIEVNVPINSDDELTGNGETTMRHTLEHVIQVPVTIHPVDDQPFTLKTQSPEIVLLQGASSVIGPKVLMTVDPDTQPERIVYEISSPASNGHLVNTVDRGGMNETIDRFTQHDIDVGKITFVQDASRESGAFYFKVSDGVHKPLFKVFNVRVTPLTLSASITGDIVIWQGDMSSVLNQSVVSVVTNGLNDRVLYNVTRSPMYGQLYRNDQVVHQFSHNDIVQGMVVYIQTDLTTSSDDLELAVYDVHNAVNGLKVKVVVKPRLQKPDEPFRVNSTSRGPTVIGLNYLDASELQMITGSDPVYYVIAAPTKGRLENRQTVSRRTRQISSTSGSGRRTKPAPSKQYPDGRKRKKGDSFMSGSRRASYVDEAVLNFTHTDVVNGHVIYQSLLPPTGTDLVIHDKFTFVLTARNAQPVLETIEIAIISPTVLSTASPHTMVEGEQSKMVHGSTIASAVSGVHAVSEGPGKAGKDHVVIVVIVAVLTTLIVVGIIVFKCVRRKRDAKKRKYEMTAVLDASTSSAAAGASVPAPQAPGTQQTQSISGNASATPTVAQPQAEVVMTLGGGSRLPPVRTAVPFPVPIIIEPPSSAVDEPTPADVSNPVTSSVGPTDSGRSFAARSPPTLPGAEGYANTLPQRNGATGSGTGGRASSSGGSRPNIWKDQVTFDWQHVDPELLQHCRTTNPILHKNQYWV